MANLDIPDSHSCWEWQGYSGGTSQYGATSVDGARVSIHRFMYEFCFGPIPEGMLVMHVCDNPPCANPRHLRTGTPLENSQDMVAKGRNRALYRKRVLTPDDVRAIRKDPRTQGAIALEYGVTQACISHVKNRRSWAKVPD
jgi:hypothetical protein